MVERLFLAVPRGCLQFVIVVLPDHTHLLFLVVLLSMSGLCSIILTSSISDCGTDVSMQFSSNEPSNFILEYHFSLYLQPLKRVMRL